MHHYPLHVGDFGTDTAPFSAEEVGVYVRLLNLYYKAEGPLPANIEDLEFNAMARTSSEKKSMAHVLRRCFTLDGEKNAYVQKRCEEVIAEYRAQGIQSRYANLCRHWPKVNPEVNKPPFDDFAKNPDSYFDEVTGHVRKVAARNPPAFRLDSDPSPTSPNSDSQPVTSNQEPITTNTPVVPKGTPTVESLAEAIYLVYPKKVGKGAAIKAIVKVIKSNEITEMELQGKVREYAAAVSKWTPQDKTYIPNPATWFNEKRYMDDPDTWKRDEPLASLPGFSEKKSKGGGGTASAEPEWDWRAVYRELFGQECFDEWSHLPKSARFEIRQEYEKNKEGGGADADDEEPVGWMSAWYELFEDSAPNSWLDVPPALQSQLLHHIEKKMKGGRGDA